MIGLRSVAFHTLGCKVNQYDTEAIWQLFQHAGYEQVDFEDPADVYVINTCTVTNEGDRKSRQMIRRATRKNPESVVVVTGCYAQMAPGEILGIPGVDLVVGNQFRSQMMELIEKVREEKVPYNAVSNILTQKEFEDLDVPMFLERTRASLKIEDGCNHFCTFCIIPYALRLSGYDLHQCNLAYRSPPIVYDRLCKKLSFSRRSCRDASHDADHEQLSEYSLDDIPRQGWSDHLTHRHRTGLRAQYRNLSDIDSDEYRWLSIGGTCRFNTRILQYCRCPALFTVYSSVSKVDLAPFTPYRSAYLQGLLLPSIGRRRSKRSHT